LAFFEKRFIQNKTFGFKNSTPWEAAKNKYFVFFPTNVRGRIYHECAKWHVQSGGTTRESNVVNLSRKLEFPYLCSLPSSIDAIMKKNVFCVPSVKEAFGERRVQKILSHQQSPDRFQ
jgi:hypothetical protein